MPKKKKTESVKKIAKAKQVTTSSTKLPSQPAKTWKIFQLPFWNYQDLLWFTFLTLACTVMVIERPSDFIEVLGVFILVFGFYYSVVYATKFFVYKKFFVKLILLSQDKKLLLLDENVIDILKISKVIVVRVRNIGDRVTLVLKDTTQLSSASASANGGYSFFIRKPSALTEKLLEVNPKIIISK